MNIVTTKKDISASLALVAGSADTGGITPILGSVLMKTLKDGSLSMTCSDQGTVARAVGLCEVKSPGAIAVDARRLSDLVRAIPEDQKIEFNEGEGNITIKAGRSRFNLPAHDAADYPKMVADLGNAVSVTIEAKTLANMVEEVSASMPSNDARPNLNGGLLRINDAGIWLVSTDGHRLTVSQEPFPKGTQIGTHELLVPRKSLLRLQKLLTKDSVELTLGTGAMQVVLADRTGLLCKGMGEKYLAWEKAVPKHEKHFDVNASQLLNALSMLSAAIDPKDKGVDRLRLEISVKGDVMTLTHAKAGQSEIECLNGTGVEWAAAFNLEYLRDAATVTGKAQERIQFRVNAPLEAILLKPTIQDYPRAVVMAMK